MKDRFDLENEISSLYHFSHQLDALSEGVIENELTNDEIFNALKGMRVLLDLHIHKMFDTMTQTLKLDEYKE